MEPEFKEGETFIISPTAKSENGDYVIVKNHEEEATFVPGALHVKGDPNSLPIVPIRSPALVQYARAKPAPSLFLSLNDQFQQNASMPIELAVLELETEMETLCALQKNNTQQCLQWSRLLPAR